MRERMRTTFRSTLMDTSNPAAWGKTGFEVTAPLHRLRDPARYVRPTEYHQKHYVLSCGGEERGRQGPGRSFQTSRGMGKFVEKIPADTQRIAVKDTGAGRYAPEVRKWSETTQFTTTIRRSGKRSRNGRSRRSCTSGRTGTRIMKDRAIEGLKSAGIRNPNLERSWTGSPATILRPGIGSSSGSGTRNGTGDGTGISAIDDTRGTCVYLPAVETDSAGTSSPLWSGGKPLLRG